MKHHKLSNCIKNFLQATSVSVENSDNLLTVLALYLPPRYTLKQEQLEDFYNTIRRQFIARDYDADSDSLHPEDAKYS
jgi:hypothetical protein